MRTLRVIDVLKDQILVSRESARLLEDSIAAVLKSPDTDAMATGESRIEMAVDFKGIEGIAPSFLDELLSVFESVVANQTDACTRCLVIMNPPTRLSLKFKAIARGHGLVARALPEGSWQLTQPS